MRMRCGLAAICLLMGSALVLPAQQRHDPLTPSEVDALRDTAQMPEKRIKLLVDDAGARLTQIETLRSDPKLTQHEDIGQLRRLINDLAEIIDEIDDNLSVYDGRGADLRKPLHGVIDADNNFQQRLRTIRETFPPEVVGKVNIELEDANDSITSSISSAQSMLDKQNEEKGKEKAAKKSR